MDGDSASLAETCAFFSALASTPISQRVALTGSVDQRGRVQTISGVNEKIEGFFKVCKTKEKNLQHGVIIPKTNIKDLMLDEEIIEACQKDEFNIYAVDTFEEALKILTGREWDKGINTIRASIIKTLAHLHNISIQKNTVPRQISSVFSNDKSRQQTSFQDI